MLNHLNPVLMRLSTSQTHLKSFSLSSHPIISNGAPSLSKCCVPGVSCTASLSHKKIRGVSKREFASLKVSEQTIGKFQDFKPSNPVWISLESLEMTKGRLARLDPSFNPTDHYSVQ